MASDTVSHAEEEVPERVLRQRVGEEELGSEVCGQGRLQRQAASVW
jgi:hypothetical protein